MKETKAAQLLKPEDAVAYLGLPESECKFLLRQGRVGKIPYVMPSPRRIMFRVEDLDAWRSGWTER